MQHPAARRVHAKATDFSRVSARVAYRPGKVEPTFGDGSWVLDPSDT